MKDKIIATFAILLAAVFTFFMVYAIWEDSNSPKLDLNKSEWSCSKEETRITNTIIAGKLMPQSHQVCTEYIRK